MTLVDTNVLLDLVMGDERFAPWSLLQLKIAFLAGPLAINDVAYTELLVRYESVGELDAMLAVLNVQIEPIPRAGLFMAAQAFGRYPAQGGTRIGVLPDFFHRSTCDSPGLRSADPNALRYRYYFPTVRLILPP